MLDCAQAIYFAAERAAGLTRQLLMFSRKNVMQPKPLDLREVVGNLSKMLKRVLGETVTLEFNPPPELPLVQADTGMIEQVIMNLAVNARDAMPEGGTLTISTNPVEMNDAYVQTHPEARARRVCLPARQRYRLRHGRRHDGPHIRAVLYHQRGRQRHRPGPGDGLWHRQTARGLD